MQDVLKEISQFFGMTPFLPFYFFTLDAALSVIQSEAWNPR